MKKAVIVMVAFLVIAMMLSAPVFASEVGSGNAWVYDEAKVISEETEEYIQNLNENVFIHYERKPQLAIVVIYDLPYSIEKYTLDLFNEYGVGTAEENCGMLFILAVNDREYALEIGDGFEKGSLLRNDLESDFITGDMKDSLRAGEYDAVVLQVAQYLEGMMAEEENGLYAQKEAEEQAKQKEQEEKMTAVEDALDKGRVWFTAALLVILLAVIVGWFAKELIREYLRKKKIRELTEANYKYFYIAQIGEGDFREYLNTRWPGVTNKDMEERFLRLLHQYYLDRQCTELDNRVVLKKLGPKLLPSYKDAVKETNNFQTFESCRLTGLESIIYSVDEAEREKEEMQKRNYALIESFLDENAGSLTHENMREEIRQALLWHILPDRLVTKDELQLTFSLAVHEFFLRREADAFIREHADVAKGQYFDKTAFYKEVASSKEYMNHRYSANYDRTWMYPLLVMHMANRKQAHQEELRRQEQEALQRSREQMKSTNSSFGTGFGGGSSSGGGFKGGW